MASVPPYSTLPYPEASATNNDIKPGEQAFVATPIQGQSIPMQPMASNGQSPLIVDSQPHPQLPFMVQSKIVYKLGVTTTVFGSCIFIAGICAVAFLGELEYNLASSGIWGGVIIIVTGVLSILSSRRPQHKPLNGVNLGFNILVLLVCIAILALSCLNIDYFDGCHRRFWVNIWNKGMFAFFNPKCPDDNDGGIAAYAILIVLAVAQLAVSITLIVFCSKAYPSCRNCNKDCCAQPQSSQQQFHHFNQTITPTYHTGHATISPNVQAIPSGQVLYMLTPVAVTSQNPQNVQIPQATLVMST